MIPARTIWCAATFCGEHARSASGSEESSITTSSRSGRIFVPDREMEEIDVVSAPEIASKESKTESIVTAESGFSAESFQSREICSCVRVIFEYNE